MKTNKNAKARQTRIATQHPSTSIYNDQETAQIMKLIKGSGSVELKVVVPAPEHRATIESIGLDPVEAQPRQAYFFDTTNFALNKAGVVVRARRIQGGRADTVIKLRPVDPSTIDRDLRRSDKKRWRKHVALCAARLVSALHLDDVVLGGGNANKLAELPKSCPAGHNSNAFLGGFRLWNKTDLQRRRDQRRQPKELAP